MEEGRATNRNFAQSDFLFGKACSLAGVKVSTRQASKYRMGRGAAFRKKAEAQKIGKKEEE